LYLPLLCVVACATAEPDPAAEEELAQLRETVVDLQSRVEQLEQRAARGGGSSKPSSTDQARSRQQQPSKGSQPAQGGAQGSKGGQTPGSTSGDRRQVEISLSGDATTVVLQNQKRRFKLPGTVPAGKYLALVAFGDGALEKRNEVMLPRDGGVVTLHCTEATQTCAVN